MITTRLALVLVISVLLGNGLEAQVKPRNRAPGKVEPTERFLRWDRNKDGKLTKSELPQALQKNFWRIDTNADGVISPAEDAALGGSSRQQTLGIKIERNVNYANDKNPRHTLDIYRPEKNSESPRPVVVFIHGGGWRNGDKRSGQNQLTRFVKTGKYVGVSIGYRLSGEAKWPAQLHDCKAAIRWIKANAKRLNIAPEKIAVWGSSAGGHLVLMLGLTGDGDDALEGKVGRHTDQSTKVCCVVNWYGPTDLLRMNDFPSSIDHDAEKSPESLLIGGPIQENQTKTRQASPVTYVSKDDPPVLTMHGDQDKLVPIDQAKRLDEALDQIGVESSWITIKNAGHGGFPREKTDKRIHQFFERHLLKAPNSKPVPETPISK